MGERRGVYRVLVGNLREREQLGDPGVDERIIQGDSFGTRPKKMRISQRLFVRF
jgi:hypothetical protein